MFVLERILRGLSEESNGKIVNFISIYDELLSKISDFRLKNGRNCDYHERFRMIVLPYLIGSVKRIKAGHFNSYDLKIFLLAHDNLIGITDNNEIDWIKVVKNLLETKEFGLIVRCLRYLKLREDQEILGNISLLLLNTLNKMLSGSDSKLNEISFVLQVIKLLDVKEIEDVQIESSLLKLLRNSKVNAQLKAMSISVMKTEDSELVMKMLGYGYRQSAVLCAALKDKFKDFKGPKLIKSSSSKLINLLNGNWETFSEVERAILENRIVKNGFISAYEQYISVLNNGDTTGITDPSILRYLLKLGKISCQEFREQMSIKLEAEDYELIAVKTCDPKLFWDCLNKIDFMYRELEVKPFTLDYMLEKDIQNYSLPVQLYFFKLLIESKYHDSEIFKPIAADLYEKYKNNFDGKAEIFKEFIDQ